MMRSGILSATIALIACAQQDTIHLWETDNPWNAMLGRSDPRNCVAAGEKCPDYGGSFWECCTWACDADNKICRECGMGNDVCKVDSDCCLGFCDGGKCAECLPVGKECGKIQYAPDGCCNEWSSESGPQLKCSKNRNVCFECLQADDECEDDDDCCHSCCEKKLFHKKGKCAPPEKEICHLLSE